MNIRVDVFMSMMGVLLNALDKHHRQGEQEEVFYTLYSTRPGDGSVTALGDKQA